MESRRRVPALPYLARLAPALLAVLVLGGCVCSPAPFDGAGDVPGLRLFYLHDLDLGNWQMFVLAPGEGHDPAQLTDAPHGVLDYAVDAGGTAIVYAALREDGGADLWVMDADGSDGRRLLACPEAQCASPAWSPDGRRIAYERREATGDGFSAPRIWLLDPGSGETAPLFANEERTGFAPRWSPDAQRSRLAYVDDAESAVRVYDFGDGSSTLIPVASDLPPTWAPAGDGILVADARISDVGIVSQIWLADVDGGTLVNVSGGDEALVQDVWPVWSPSGAWIAFTRRVLAGEEATLGHQLWLMRPDGDEARSLLIDPAATFSRVAWRPDGGALAYVRRPLTDPDARPELWLLDLPDGEPTLLAEVSAAPAWAPWVFRDLTGSHCRTIISN
jgi:Tol biopolymer transport system component